MAAGAGVMNLLNDMNFHRGWPGFSNVRYLSAGHSFSGIWHYVLSPALDLGSSNVAGSPRELGPVPQPQLLLSAPSPRCHASTHQGSFRAGCLVSLLPNLCPTQSPGAALAQAIHRSVGVPVEGATAPASSSSSATLTLSVRLPTNLGSREP